MTLVEYYNLPEGTNLTLKYTSFYDTVDSDYPCPPDMSYAFSNQQRTIIKHLNTSNVTNMSYVFYNCNKFISLDLTSWNVSNVTNMNGAFYGCNGLTTINLSSWDTSNVTNMKSMFQSCENLITIDLSSWDTSNVTDMNSMFYNCMDLQSIDFSNCNTSKVTDMTYMFATCSRLEKVGAINCSGLSGKNKYPFQYYSNHTVLTQLGGFYGMKYSWDNTYGLTKLPNLTYQSCINVLNGLYDFVSANETPTSTQGVLKVHSNFLTTVGDEISIGTNKGWTITA